MLELDGCSRQLITNPFADDNHIVSPNGIHETPVSRTPDSSSEHHPLRTRSVSPARRSNTSSGLPVTVIGSGRLTCPLGSDRSSTEVAIQEDRTTASHASQDGTDVIIHHVGPSDSFAGVALRYGVSIAAIRRANQLWPSDPIHLRTELLIPRGDTLPPQRKPAQGRGMDTLSRCAVEPTPGLSSGLLSSTFVAARNMILSLPARISLESLSSRASAPEDHELDDLRIARARKISLTEEGYELPTLAAPHAQYAPLDFPLSSQDPYSSSNHRLPNFNRIPFIGDGRSRSISSLRTMSLERLPRMQPFASLPVRTSQLEPEPAMELPIRRPRLQQSSSLDVRHIEISYWGRS